MTFWKSFKLKAIHEFHPTACELNYITSYNNRCHICIPAFILFSKSESLPTFSTSRSLSLFRRWWVKRRYRFEIFRIFLGGLKSVALQKGGVHIGHRNFVLIRRNRRKQVLTVSRWAPHLCQRLLKI